MSFFVEYDPDKNKKERRGSELWIYESPKKVPAEINRNTISWFIGSFFIISLFLCLHEME